MKPLARIAWLEYDRPDWRSPSPPHQSPTRPSPYLRYRTRLQKNKRLLPKRASGRGEPGRLECKRGFLGTSDRVLRWQSVTIVLIASSTAQPKTPAPCVGRTSLSVVRTCFWTTDKDVRPTSAQAGAFGGR